MFSDENRVNMFEEDFDSEDECHKTLHSYVSKASNIVPQSEEVLTSFNEILETNASIVEEQSESLTLEEGAQQTPQQVDTELRLDSWLDAVEENRPSNVRRLSSTSSSESGQNPLVAKFEDVGGS